MVVVVVVPQPPSLPPSPPPSPVFILRKHRAAVCPEAEKHIQWTRSRGGAQRRERPEDGDGEMRRDTGVALCACVCVCVWGGGVIAAVFRPIRRFSVVFTSRCRLLLLLLPRASLSLSPRDASPARPRPVRRLLGA